MQRLEVSCAVRRIYMSLGAKGLIVGFRNFVNANFKKKTNKVFDTSLNNTIYQNFQNRIKI